MYVKGNNAIIKENVVVGKNVIIEDDVYIDSGTIIRDNVHIKKGSFIGPNCILGEYTMDFYKDKKEKFHPLVIGENALIRSGTIIYGDCNIGDNFQTGHRVTIREESYIGNNVRVGTNTDIQGRCKIGNYTSIHSGCFICEFTEISEYVWVFPNVTITNDKTPPSQTMKGAIIEDFAVVCAKSILLPGVRIGKKSMVCAASIVSKDVEEGTIVIGQPAKLKCKASELINRDIEESVYPWMNRFDRGMPWKKDEFYIWEKENYK